MPVYLPADLRHQPEKVPLWQRPYSIGGIDEFERAQPRILLERLRVERDDYGLLAVDRRRQVTACQAEPCAVDRLGAQRFDRDRSFPLVREAKADKRVKLTRGGPPLECSSRLDAPTVDALTRTSTRSSSRSLISRA
jgi:hypothetical protein